ncbi:hypothetical protein AKJ51_00865 [candidate division MSBL1 archaeon SCGC-AAA382A20]|uniref:Uncharacterized protein n=1 Tax=candidate division MSBL1 archaeon SCGC-AAA382A20 TaxID=1698280 RepID=A0A133VMB7_9EURY|nr:hypothetical protein AKJ51_00865 [candidate division MSBL1 archaeon SCGC-AAA382A20]
MPNSCLSFYFFIYGISFPSDHHFKILILEKYDRIDVIVLSKDNVAENMLYQFPFREGKP